MRQLCIALAVVAGCGFEHGRLGSRSDASLIDVASLDALVDARMIDAPPNVVPDAMVDAPPAIVDTDGDTVADSVDNCRLISNTNQRNHDGDTPGDACDRCPHLPNNLDPDADNDGVGDACDPRPSTAGEVIVLFEGFYEAPTGWVTNGPGTWTVANGVATQSSTATGGSLYGPPTVVARAAVTARFRVIAFGSGGGFDTPAISIAAGVAGTNPAYYCSVSTANANDIYATAFWSTGFSIDNVDWPGTFTTNSEIQLTEIARNNTENCTAREGNTVVSVPQISTGASSGQVRLSTTSASASFDYLFVVAIGA